MSKIHEIENTKQQILKVHKVLDKISQEWQIGNLIL